MPVSYHHTHRQRHTHTGTFAAAHGATALLSDRHLAVKSEVMSVSGEMEPIIRTEEEERHASAHIFR